MAHVLYRMVTLPTTLSDPNHPKSASKLRVFICLELMKESSNLVHRTTWQTLQSG